MGEVAASWLSDEQDIINEQRRRILAETLTTNTGFKRTCVFKTKPELLPWVKGNKRDLLLKNIYIQICLLQTGFKNHRSCSLYNEVTKRLWVHSRGLTADRLMHRHEEHIKDSLWRTQRTKSLWATNQRWEMEINWNEMSDLFSACSHDGNVSESCWEGRRTHNPSSTPLHFTSTGSAVCQLPALRLDS